MNSLHRTVYLAVALAIIAALLGGCGSSGDDGSTDGSTVAFKTSSLSKAQWIKKAGEVCTTWTTPIIEKVNAYEEKHRGKTSREAEVVAGKAIRQEIPPLMTNLAKGIRALGAPEGDEDQISAFVVAFEGDTEKVATGPSLKSLTEFEPNYRDSAKIARQYGLTGCAFG